MNENLLDSNFFGALAGAGITGLITIIIFTIDKVSEYRSKKNENENMKLKYQVFYRTKSNIIIESAERINFFIGLIDANHNYNIEPVDEISKNLKEIKESAFSLAESNLELVESNLYVLTEQIMEYVNLMSSNFDGVLATEEEDFWQSIDLLHSNSQKLIKFIQEDVIEKDI